MSKSPTDITKKDREKLKIPSHCWPLPPDELPLKAKRPLEDLCGPLLQVPLGLTKEATEKLEGIAMTAGVPFRQIRQFREDVDVIITRLHGLIHAVIPSENRATSKKVDKIIQKIKTFTLEERILFEEKAGMECIKNLMASNSQPAKTKQAVDNKYLIEAACVLCKKYDIKFQSGNSNAVKITTIIAQAASIPLGKNTIRNLINQFIRS